MNIAIIGAGQLGSRHLQALSFLKGDVFIQVLDPNPESLNVARLRMQSTDYDRNRITVEYIDSYSELNSMLNVAIVATGADVRCRAILSLFEVADVHNLILEKVLFQHADEYELVEEIIAERNVSAWVNCPRRTFEIYKDIKSQINQQILHMSVTGGDWGLACNAIHYFDLFAYLTSSPIKQISTSDLLKKTISSKRENFIELVGTLNANTSNGCYLSLSSFEYSNAPIVVSITTGNSRYIIKETERKISTSTEQTEWAWKESDYKVPFQSELTHLVVQQILDEGDCNLVSFCESKALHITMITAINEFLSVLQGNKVERCPIT